MDTHTHTHQKPTNNDTCAYWYGFSWIWVRIRAKMPMGYPCQTLPLLLRSWWGLLFLFGWIIIQSSSLCTGVSGSNPPGGPLYWLGMVFMSVLKLVANWLSTPCGEEGLEAATLLYSQVLCSEWRLSGAWSSGSYFFVLVGDLLTKQVEVLVNFPPAFWVQWRWVHSVAILLVNTLDRKYLSEILFVLGG